MIGCVGLIGSALAALIYYHGMIVVAVLALGVVAALAIDIARRLWTRFLVARFHRTHPGKHLLVIYTDSDAWRDRIEQGWLALWGERMVVLNRSRPWSPRQLEARLWRAYASAEEHTPMAIHLPKVGRPSVVLFYSAFREWQHNRPDDLLEAESQLARLMGAEPPSGAT